MSRYDRRTRRALLYGDWANIPEGHHKIDEVVEAKRHLIIQTVLMVIYVAAALAADVALFTGHRFAANVALVICAVAGLTTIAYALHVRRESLIARSR